MAELITQNFGLFILGWLICAIVTSIFAKSKNRSFFQWLLIGMFFGIGGIILVLIVTRNDRKVYTVPSKDIAGRKLWYAKVRSGIEKSKTANYNCD